MLRYAVSYGEHALEQCLIGIITQTAYLAGRAHVNAQHRVGLLQTVEGELACLDADLVEVEEVLRRFLYRHTKHNLRGKVNKIELQHLAYEWERAGGAEVALYYEDVVITGHELDIEHPTTLSRFGHVPRWRCL